MLKICLIVDAGYLANLQKRFFSIDLLKFKNFIETKLNGKVTRGYYITSLDTPSQNGFHSWLKSSNGPKLEVVIKNQKSKLCDNCGNVTWIEKGIDVAIVTLAIKNAQKDLFDTLVLVNGDGDLVDALKYIRDDLGKELVLFGEIESISTELQAISSEILIMTGNRTELEKQER